MHALNLAHEELERIARTDQLTGLLNRRGFLHLAEAAINSARVTQCPATLLMCDIDFFKCINDQFGHDGGDVVLSHIAEVMRSALGEQKAILGRQGGEEFIVLLPGFSFEEASVAAEAIRIACLSRPVKWNAQVISVTMSIGLAASARAESDLSALISRADLALYDAKRNGRNQIVALQEDRSLAKAA